MCCLVCISVCAEGESDEIFTDAAMGRIWYLIYISSGHRVIWLSACHISKQQSDNVSAAQGLISVCECLKNDSNAEMIHELLA